MTGSLASLSPHPSRAATPSTIIVDKGIPLPGKGSRGRLQNERSRIFNRRYPWSSMSVGDSFLFPEEGDGRPTQRAASRAAGCRMKAYPDEAYTTRIVTENGARVCRIWRTA